jgi:hypothetical protein
MKKIVALTFASISLALPLVSHAQFGGLGNLLGGNKAPAKAGADLGGQQDQLTRNYVAAGKDVLIANGQLAEALGIKAQAINASATSDSLSASDIENQDKAISANATAVSDAMKSGATLKDSESKMKYSQGLITLVSGVKKYIGMRSDVQSFSSSLSSVSPMQLPKLQAGAYIVKSLPTSISNLSSVLKSAIDFAKHNGVEVPADATSVL